MGSSSTSITSYANAAPTVQDNENPIVLAGSGNAVRLGSDVNLSGESSFSILDGGAIAAAFGLGEKSIAAVGDLTAKLLAANSQVNVNALDFTGRANAAANALANPDAAAETMTNKTLWIFAGLAAVYFLMKGRF